MCSRDCDRTISISAGSVRETGERLLKVHACLVVLQGAEIGRDFRLRKPGLTIGRSPEADIRLLDQQASRIHARIQRPKTDPVTGVVYEIEDLGSTNRTFVNGRAVTSCVRLADGDKVRIGDTVLKFVLLDEVEARFHAEIRDRIKYDQLTGLLTKESLFIAMEAELDRCLEYGLPLSVLMMDLDFFKSVNDTHGHLMGSHVLAEVGRVIRGSIRDADVSGRYGGEEFVSYLAETDTRGATVAAERIREAVAAHRFTLDGNTIEVRISIGVATAPLHGSHLYGLVHAADLALYRAKESGRNRVCAAR